MLTPSKLTTTGKRLFSMQINHRLNPFRSIQVLEASIGASTPASKNRALYGSHYIFSILLFHFKFYENEIRYQNRRTKHTHGVRPTPSRSMT